MIWKTVKRAFCAHPASRPMALVGRGVMLSVFAWCVCGAAVASESAGHSIEGEWRLVADDLDQEVVMHIERDPNGALTGLVCNASPEDMSPALTLEAVTFEKGTLCFEAMSGQAAFEGTMQENGLTIEGQWRQPGQESRALVLKRVGSAPMSAAPRSAEPEARSVAVAWGIEGDWRLLIDGLDREAVLHFEREPDGTLGGMIRSDVPDESKPTLVLEAVTFEEGALHFETKSGQVIYEGTMEADGLTITGQWRQQGQALALVLKRAGPSQAPGEGQERPSAEAQDDGSVAQTPQGLLRGDARLVAWWRFDGDANDGTGINHGTVRGDATYVAGRSGQALSLDGDDYVDCGNATILNFDTGDWAVSAWIKTTQSGTEDEDKGTIFANGADGGGGIRYTLAVNEAGPGRVTLTTDDDSYKIQATSGIRVNDGAWHHIVGVRYGTNLRLHADGILEAESSLPAEYSLAGASQHHACVGAINDQGKGSLVKYFVGQIDEVCVFACALGEGNIKALYSGAEPKTVARDATVAPVAAVAGPIPNRTGSSSLVAISILLLGLAGLVGGIVLFIVKSR